MQHTKKADADGFATARHPQKARRRRYSTSLWRSGRSVVGVVGFFVLFTLLLLLVYRFYMIPWIAESQHASKSHLRKMSAEALLLMCVLLSILFSGLLVTFRISRFFVQPPAEKRTQTKVVDAWSEAGRRMENEPAEEPDGDDSERQP